MRYFTIMLILFLYGCSNSATDKNIDIELSDNNKVLDKRAHMSDEDVIFYNAFSPLDTDKILDRKSSYFNSAYINSLNNITRYTNSQKIALNIGVYGADLSYLWIFDQNQQALSYITAIQMLTDKLGIPDNLVDNTANSIEQNSNEIDSMIAIARNSYFATDSFLKETNRENYALLIILGGWVECMYIALNMYNQPDSKFAGKIITQKYSLNSLITMAQNCSEDIVISEYLLLMKKMRDTFSDSEFQLKPGDIDIDTVNKQITIKSIENSNIEPSHFAELKSITSQIRRHIID